MTSIANEKIATDACRRYKFIVPSTVYHAQSQWFAAIGLLAVFVLDRIAHAIFGDVTVAPLVAVILLAAIALRLTPIQLLLWTPVYALLCFLLLTYWRASFTWQDKQLPGDWMSATFFWRAVVRAATVLVAGVLCALLSRQRERLQALVDETTAVMTALPSGVLISDPSGFISFANDKAVEALGVCRGDLLGSSFFSLLTAPHGNTIEKYAALCEVPGENSGNLKLQLRRKPEVRLTAKLFCLQTSTGRMIATVLDEKATPQSAG